MSEISTLTIKIPLELKEKIKAAALENDHSLSAEVCKRLESSFQVPDKPSKKQVALHHDEIDSQHTEEENEQPLSQKELKKLRLLLKGGVKSGKKK
ncbi:regulatory protein [Chania multitudinisentens RB-25]|uniref:Regulatory protein n=1 Tax=Chania multitudinisentens RB-25 TaxID=1441930 RepID=W0L3A6_9GAMM|nr:Arc family DNA-binding protein [Chania multitudinisentens]AHG18243.1 regulatory protein [Chania multitudinisentens RB-25]